ncbi:ATP-dependent DNA helicase Q4 [Caerostris darwini]|uniref:DNA 3'-5' helicase n=1 Tax=Caerostris darwini TaxID=1538125 RepID=A0AAV4VVJ9_9ARAC|nr:ATP-dependent DNA helicase Q4 [Caerostris darwini]
MSEIEKKELKILKLKIKSWESEFFKLKSKKPSKEDIHDSPCDVKDAYRKYWKLKSKIENPTVEIEDHIWSNSLNKCFQKSKNAKGEGNLMKFCERIKQKSNITSNKNYSPRQAFKDTVTEYKNYFSRTDLTSLDENSETNNANITNPTNLDDNLSNADCQVSIPNKISIDKDDLQELDFDIDSISTSDFSKEINELDSEMKIETTKTPMRLIKSQDIHKKFSSASLLYSSINLTNSPKTLHFKQNIDKKWLDRCHENILNNSEEVVASKCSTNEISEKLLNQLQKSTTPSQKSELSDFHATNSEVSDSLQFISDCSYKEFGMKKDNLETPDKSITNVDETYDSVFDSNKCLDKIKRENTCLSNNDIHDANDKDENVSLSNSNLDLLNAKKNELCETEIKKGIKRKLSSISYSSPNVSYKTDRLKKKIAAGTLNENFVSLNIKKKKFSRGHRSVNIKKLKWNKWKKMKQSSNNTGNVPIITGCFKCGQLGHWARQCNVSTTQKETTFSEEDDITDIPLPTLEEATKLAEEATKTGPMRLKNKNSEDNSSKESHSTCLAENEKKQSLSNTNQDYGLTIEEIDIIKDSVKPLYETYNEKLISTPRAVYSALKEMGYSNFRNGQESAVMRVLCGLSTLVVLPTGSGKSLCYQLPAYMYAKHSRSLAIVVSPLVSLMEDQVTGLPSCLHAVCLHSGMTDIQRSNAIKDINDGVAQILLVSPEAIISDYRLSNIISNSSMPPISFVCIDEVHCISQWSHNFRPSYLQLYKVLTKKMGVKCILGLTATATQSTIEDIISNLELKCTNESVIGHTNIPENLNLSVSRDKDKDRALIQLLSGDRFKKCSSIIIYCIRRNETERLAALIRTCMQDEIEPDGESIKKKKTKSKKRCFAWTAEAYHAGLLPSRRRSVQKQFMSGKLRIVIATVAFGMGLDKPDVRAIIHYNMPKNFESYVQEIGRAGRDGLESHCHLFLDSEGNDLYELQKHIHSNSIDRHTLRKLLRRVFVPCKCSSTEKPIDDMVQMNENTSNTCPKHEVAFPINETVQELDVKQENISTLLCYLELHSKQWIEILSPTYATCTIRCYGGSKQMHSIALKNPAIATAIALDAENGKKWEKGANLTFEVVKIASAIGWESSQLKRNLKQLEWNAMKRKTGVIVEFSDLAFHVSAPGNLSDEEMDAVLNFLYNKVVTTEETELQNLKLLFSVFKKYSFPHYWECCDEVNTEYSNELKTAINKYFSRSDVLSEELNDMEKTPIETNKEVDLQYVKSLIKDLICIHQDHNFTGRAIARIFHGIASPCFPSEVWGRVYKFWRCLLHVNFNTILKLANEELRNFK